MNAPPTLPPFNAAVPDGGYRWWYLDAISHCGQHALTIISSIGSVFSPYYLSGRANGAASAIEYSSFNIALYGRTKGWAMTERSSRWVQRSADSLIIGPSQLHRDDHDSRGFQLHYALREMTVPLPRRIRGDIWVHCPPAQGEPQELDWQGRHYWWPAVPIAAVSVSLRHPRLYWHGSAYVDSNWGSEPLEKAFRRWDWSRVHRRDGSAVIFYDVELRHGQPRQLAFEADARGTSPLFEPPARQRLKATPIWRMPRQTRASAEHLSVQTLEDTPFYSRSQLRFHDQLWQDGVHESVDLDRFCRRSTQWMLPFRMPRRR